jgi:3'-phosphoadenosine 5'-phosphosulfate sulfotransferase (PAPS reductase)/FAD synthetase
MKWKELEKEQAKSLDYKIRVARRIFAQAFDRATRPALAFSGGKDSTVLLDLVRRFFPSRLLYLKVIYGNTGVEFPRCVKFARWLANEWQLDFVEARPGQTDAPGFKYEAQRRIWQRLIDEGRINEVLKKDGKLKSIIALERACPPDLRAELERERLVWKEGARMNYWWCVDQYGWPLLGKDWSKLDARRINIDTFLRFSKSQSKNPKLLEYYEILRQVKISQHCCYRLKKEPAERVQAESGIDLIFKGLMAAESRTRAINFLTRGYLFEGAKRDHLRGRPFFHCQPMAIWTDEDVWAYIRRYSVPYASLYDLTYTGLDGRSHNIKRNGCLGCGTDIRFADNHIAVLRQTHPKVWRTLMKKGMAREINKLQRALRPAGQLTLFDAKDPEWIVDFLPCVFDDLDGVGGLSRRNGRLIYDPEGDDGLE